MAKEAVSERSRAINQVARRAASAAGKEWTSLTQDERKKYKQEARGQMRGSRGAEKKSGQSAVREKAKQAAQQAGVTWAELSKEKRQEYLRQARGKA
jgi:hypothetical protein